MKRRQFLLYLKKYIYIKKRGKPNVVRRAQPCGKFMALNCIVSKEYLSYWSWYRCSVKCSSDVTCWLANWLAGIIIVRKRRCIQQTNKEAHRKGGNTSSTAVLMAKERGGVVFQPIQPHPALEPSSCQDLAVTGLLILASRRFSHWILFELGWMADWLDAFISFLASTWNHSLLSLLYCLQLANTVVDDLSTSKLASVRTPLSLFGPFNPLDQSTSGALIYTSTPAARNWKCGTNVSSIYKPNFPRWSSCFLPTDRPDYIGLDSQRNRPNPCR